MGKVPSKTQEFLILPVTVMGLVMVVPGWGEFIITSAGVGVVVGIGDGVNGGA